jgi:predicted TPR repeat methyltransferase
MSTADDDMQAAMTAHKAGRFADAEMGYRRVLDARPEDPKALYYLGLLQFHCGDTEGAISLVRRSLARAPSIAPAWNTLGGLYIAVGRIGDAREAYRRMTLAAPSMGEGWYNLGICLRDEGDIEGAVAALRTSVEREPGFFRSYEALATVLYRLGRTQEAGALYKEWESRDPANPMARHMAAAASQENVPTRAADDYVQALFDQSAKSFDDDVTRLGYRAPSLVAEALTRFSEGHRYPALLDAGCGTGLCGPLVRSACERLVGMDLSSKMVDRARQRDCYDEVHVAELVAFMRDSACAFDAIICADTLVYFGALEEPLLAMRLALRPGGVVVFTLEALGLEVATDNFRLEAHGRYAHCASYVDRALTEAGFQVVTLSLETLREERGQPVEGFLVAARLTGRSE